MRKLAFAIAAMATALAVAPAAMADTWQMLTGSTSPVSTSSTSISMSSLGTLITTISGVATPTPTLGDPNPFQATYTEAVYVGDMAIDVQVARAAGIVVCVIPTGSDDRAALEAARPDRILGGLLELLEVVVASRRT